MSTLWPTHKHIQLNRQLNKHTQKVHIRYDTIDVETVSYWLPGQRRRYFLPFLTPSRILTAQDIAPKLSEFIDHKIRR